MMEGGDTEKKINVIKDRSVLKHWHIIYPAYLEKGFTARQGRRVPKEIAVEKPKLDQISAVLQFLKLRHCVELDKAYPRDWLTKGRIRVLLKDEHGQLMHPIIETSEIERLMVEQQMLKKLCELIPKLKSRVQDPEEKQTGKKKKNKKNK